MSEKEKWELDSNPDHEELDEGDELDVTDELDEDDGDEAGEEKTPAKAAKKPKAAAAKKSKPVERKKGNRIGRFFKDMRIELKKVAWPTRKQTVNNTGIVIAVVLVAGAFVWVFDGIAGSLIGALIKLFGA